MFYQNRGMFLESIINYTIEIINSEKTAFIFKEKTWNFKENKHKGTVDYHGIYNGKYICFEAKSTQKNYLSWNSFKKHQLEFLDTILVNNGISFIIIYFSKHNIYFLIFWEQLKQLKETNFSISLEWLQKNGHKLEICYPFYLNFLNFIRH